jgi:hypothetical protein
VPLELGLVAKRECGGAALSLRVVRAVNQTAVCEARVDQEFVFGKIEFARFIEPHQKPDQERPCSRCQSNSQEPPLYG